MEILNKAEQAEQLFFDARNEGVIWAITSMQITQQQLINLTIGHIKQVTLGEYPMIQFNDESLIVFKSGGWAKYGYYSQTQDKLI